MHIKQQSRLNLVARIILKITNKTAAIKTKLAGYSNAVTIFLRIIGSIILPFTFGSHGVRIIRRIISAECKQNNIFILT